MRSWRLEAEADTGIFFKVPINVGAEPEANGTHKHISGTSWQLPTENGHLLTCAPSRSWGVAQKIISAVDETRGYLGCGWGRARILCRAE